MGHSQLGDAELAPVDPGVVAGGEPVAVEAPRHVLVRHHPGRGPVPLRGLLLEQGHAEHVVHVAVRVDRGVERSVGRPVADLLVHERRHEVAAGVHQHEPVGGAERRHVRQGGDEREVLGRLHELALEAHRVVVLDSLLAAPEAVGQLQYVGHRGPA